jgi:hypothetical protein
MSDPVLHAAAMAQSVPKVLPLEAGDRVTRTE